MKPNQLILIPGMPSFAWRLKGLEVFLKEKLLDYDVHLVSLLFGMLSFNEQVQRVVDACILPKRLVLFGHSHGGRIACAVANIIKQRSPEAKIQVIIAGTPVVVRPNDVPWYDIPLYAMCPAFGEWPDITQPSANYIGYYSEADTVVKSKFAKAGFTGKLIELQNFSHGDLISAKKMGPTLLELLVGRGI